MKFRYRESEYVRLFRIDDGKMDVLVIFLIRCDIVYDEVVGFEIEISWSIDGDRVCACGFAKI